LDLAGERGAVIITKCEALQPHVIPMVQRLLDEGMWEFVVCICIMGKENITYIWTHHHHHHHRHLHQRQGGGRDRWGNGGQEVQATGVVDGVGAARRSHMYIYRVNVYICMTLPLIYTITPKQTQGWPPTSPSRPSSSSPCGSTGRTSSLKYVYICVYVYICRCPCTYVYIDGDATTLPRTHSPIPPQQHLSHHSNYRSRKS
jgi:hypothetical protein